MAIKGTVTHKGLSGEGYVKVTIGGISERIIRVEGENYDPTKWKDPSSPEPWELEEMTVPQKGFFLQYNYAVKTSQDGEQILSGQKTVEVDIKKPLYPQAYKHLAIELGIT